MRFQAVRKFLIVAVATFSLAAAAAESSPLAIATRLLDRLDAGQFDPAVAEFGGDMKAAVPADRLKQIWQSLPAQVGAASGRGTAQISKQEGVTLVQIPLHYARAELIAKVA